MKTLHRRTVTVWDDKFGGEKPHWRTFCKPPIRKRSGDLQWSILHCAIATNSFFFFFVSYIAPGFLNDCPFCSLSKNLLHVFMDCAWLTTFFNLLMNILSLFGVVFYQLHFINGKHYSKATKLKSQILYF